MSDLEKQAGERTGVHGDGSAKKVVAFVGSARKKGTYEAVSRFFDHMKALGGVECEIVMLSDYRLGACRGCKICFSRGEESCSLKDDRDILIRKMDAADGVVFASPNYEFQVSAFMKLFLDRLGFCFHRPRFFGKAFTSIVSQGFFGGGKIVKYLEFAGACMGFNVVKGGCITTLEPMTEAETQAIGRSMEKLARRFHEGLAKPPFPAPSLIMLSGFRMGRATMKLELDECSRDYTHYRDRGWLESDYFYPVRLGLFKRLAGAFFENLAVRRLKKRWSRTAPALRPSGMKA